MLPSRPSRTSNPVRKPLIRGFFHPVYHAGGHAGDPIVTVHILVTEIESAIRILAGGLGLTLQKQNRMGGYDLKNLGDFLADEMVAGFFTEDIVTYLRVVLTDRRGWNLRNKTCHGILPAASFTQAASQRLLHIVLLLSAVRSKAGSEGQTEEQPQETSSSSETPPAGGV